jgi:hypothetical protein
MQHVDVMWCLIMINEFGAAMTSMIYQCEKWITNTPQQPIVNEPKPYFAKAYCLPK